MRYQIVFADAATLGDADLSALTRGSAMLCGEAAAWLFFHLLFT